MKLAVSSRAVIQRINRLLAQRKPVERLVVARRVRGFVTPREVMAGRFFLVRNRSVVKTFIDLEAFARDIGALENFEKVEDGYMG